MTVFHINHFINPVFDLYFRYLIRSITFRKKLFFSAYKMGPISTLQTFHRVFGFNFYRSQDIHQYSTEIVQFLISPTFYPKQNYLVLYVVQILFIYRVNLALQSLVGGCKQLPGKGKARSSIKVPVT